MPIKTSQQKRRDTQQAKSALEPYTLMRGPDFFGFMLALFVAWLCRNTVSQHATAIIAIGVYISSAYLFLYVKKRLGWVDANWSELVRWQLKGFIVAVPIFIALYYFGYFK